MSSEDDVRAASAKFYAALNTMLTGDAGAMAGAWWHEPTVTTMHPIGGCNTGWEAVADSFAQVAKLCSGGKVAITDQRLAVGADMAYELGQEEGSATMAGTPVTIDHRVTNVYRLKDGEWRVVHHHTDTSPAMLALLAKLQKG